MQRFMTCLEGMRFLALAAILACATGPARAGVSVYDVHDALQGGSGSESHVIDMATGSLDGDLIEDLVVSVAIDPDTNGVGVIPGRPSGWGVMLGFDATLYTFSSLQTGDRLGQSMAIGDVDGDGRGDLVVGAPATGQVAGQVLILMGAGDGDGDQVPDYPELWDAQLNGNAYQRVSLGGPGARFGEHVVVGALDDDAMAELVVCAPAADESPYGGGGAAYVFRGRNDWPDPTTGITAGADRVYYGEVGLCSAMAIGPNPLGMGQVLLLADAQDAGGTGRIHVVDVPGNYGNPAVSVFTDSIAIIEGGAAGDGLGSSAVLAPGITGDAPLLAFGLPGLGGHGAVYLLDVAAVGGGTIHADTAKIKVMSSSSGAQFGKALATAYGFGQVGTGVVWAGAALGDFMGPEAGGVAHLSATALHVHDPMDWGDLWTDDFPGVVLGAEPYGHAGAAIAVGDLDGDLEDDLIVAEPDSAYGAVYILRSADYPDGDGDSWVREIEDCEDDADWVFPYAGETCDGLDSDCDGALLPDEEDWDGDGFLACHDDCDDDDPDIHPDAPEDCEDGIDNDCDGAVDKDDDECDDPGDDDDDDDDDAGDDDDTKADDDDGYAAGFQCECRQARGGFTPVAAILALALVAALRRR